MLCKGHILIDPIFSSIIIAHILTDSLPYVTMFTLTTEMHKYPAVDQNFLPVEVEKLLTANVFHVEISLID